MNHIKDKYHIYFLTKGTDKNNWHKVNWFKTILPHLSICLIEQDYIIVPVKHEQSKEDMIDRIMVRYIIDLVYEGVKVNTIFNSLQLIQVDDNYSNLGTICNLHILLKERETDYNQVEDIRDDLYIAHNLSDVEQILKFYSVYSFEELEELDPQRKTLIERIKNIIKKLKENYNER